MRSRPALLFTLCYGAGLATGLLRFGGPAGTLAVLGAAAATRQPAAVLFGAAATLGRLSGELARKAEAGRCTSRLPAGRVRLTVRVLEPVEAEGGRVQVAPVGAGCGGEVGARWPAGGPIAAGYTSRIEGTWVPRPGPGGRAGGMLVVSGAGRAEGAPRSAAGSGPRSERPAARSTARERR